MSAAHKASDFAPLTPEILRRATKFMLREGCGMCWAVRCAFERDGGHYDFDRWGRAGFRRLYEAAEEVQWVENEFGYLVRFGLSDGRAAREKRAACLLRMANWLEALERDMLTRPESGRTGSCG